MWLNPNFAWDQSKKKNNIDSWDTRKIKFTYRWFDLQ